VTDHDGGNLPSQAISWRGIKHLPQPGDDLIGASTAMKCRRDEMGLAVRQGTGIAQAIIGGTIVSESPCQRTTRRSIGRSRRRSRNPVDRQFLRQALGAFSCEKT